MEKCDQCQQMKNRNDILAEKLMPNAMLKKPQQYIIVDFITKSPQSKSTSNV